MSDVGAPLDEPHRGGRHKSVFTYVHDKWQLRSNITIDLGLRHEFYTPVTGFHGRGGMSSYDPETNTLRVAGYGDIPVNLGVENYWFNFNPRTGISWRINDSNVVRAGYGVSAEGGPSQTGQLYPITQSQNIVGPNSFAAAGSLRTGIPAPSLAQIPENGILPAIGPLLSQSLSEVLLDARHNGQLRSWNVAYQRTLPGAFTAEMAYVGNRANDVWSGENINASTTLGADQAGQPLFVKYGRTASTTVQVRDGRPQNQVRFDANQGRPPYEKRLHDDQLVHIGTWLQLRQRHTGPPKQIRAGLGPQYPLTACTTTQRALCICSPGGRRASGSARVWSAGYWVTGK